MNNQTQQFQEKFEKMTQKEQLAAVNRLIKKYNKAKNTSLFLERNWSNTMWVVTERHWDKIGFDYNEHLWVIALRLDLRLKGLY